MATEKKSRPQPRRIGRWIFLAVLILLACTYALRAVLIAPLAIAVVERAVADNLGLQISIGNLGGTYISNLEMQNVTTVSRLAEGPLTDLQVRRLTLTYRIVDILRGLSPFLAETAIEMEGARLTLRLTGETDPAAEVGSPVTIALPQSLPQVRIEDSSLEIKGADYQTRVEGISLSVKSSPPVGDRIELLAADWSLTHAALRPIAAGLRAELYYSPESLRIGRLMVGEHELVKSATIELGALPDRIPFELSASPAGGRLETSGRLTATGLQVSVAGTGLDLSQVSGLLAPPSISLGGLLALKGRLQLPFARPETMQGDFTVEVADGTVNTATVNRLSLEFTADGQNLAVKDLLLADGANRLTISSATIPAGAVFEGDPDMILHALAADWHLEGSDIPALLKLAGILPAKPDTEIPSHRLNLNGQTAGGDITIPSGRLNTDKGHIDLKDGRIALPLGERTLAQSALSADLKVDLPDLVVLAKVLSLPALGGSLKARVNVSGTLSAPRGTADIIGHALTYQNRGMGNLSIRALADARRVVIESATLERGSDRAVAQGTIDIEQRAFEDFKIEAAISDLNPYFSELIPLFQPPGQKALDVRGGLEASARLAGPLDRPGGSLAVRTRQLQIAGLALGNAHVDLTAAGEIVRVLASVTGAEQRLELGGNLQRNQGDTEFIIDLKKAVLARNDTLLGLEHEARCRVFRNGGVMVDNLVLAGAAGRLTVDGRFDPQGPTDLLITLADFRSDGWLDMVAADEVRFSGLDARLRVAGRPDAPSFTLEGSLANIGSGKVPMAFSGRFNLQYHDKTLSLREFEWQGPESQQIQLTGSLPLDLYQTEIFVAGPLALTGRLSISDASVLDFAMPWAAKTGGSIRCDLDLSGSWQRPSGRLHLAVEDVRRPDEIRPLPPGPYTVSGDLSIDGDRLVLDKLAAHSSQWQLQARGQWTGMPALIDMVRSDSLRMTGELDLEGSLAVSDLSWAAAELDGIRRLAGRLEVRGRLQGPITAPRADAVVKLAEGELTPNVDMPALRALNLDAVVTPQVITVRSLAGEMGGAPFELTGSWQLAAGSAYEADLRLQGQNLLLYRDESLRLRADTDLTLKGPLARLALDGEVAVTDGLFSKSFGVLEGISAIGTSDAGGGFRLFSITDPPLRDLGFNVRITTREPFVVRNNLVRGSVRPDLLLTGTGETPLLVGKVYVGSTRLYLPAGRIQLETGLVRFEKADPERPRLDLVGTSTMLGYDITAVIDGPYDEPVITLSSIPPLPDEDLLMLLLTGQPPKSSGTRGSETKQSLNVAVFLGRDLLSRWFDGDEDDATEDILDRFDVEVGRAITRQGEETIHSQFRLADNVLMDGDSLYLTGERDYFDYYNGGIKLVFRFR